MLLLDNLFTLIGVGEINTKIKKGMHNMFDIEKRLEQLEKSNRRMKAIAATAALACIAVVTIAAGVRGINGEFANLTVKNQAHIGGQLEVELETWLNNRLQVNIAHL